MAETQFLQGVALFVVEDQTSVLDQAKQSAIRDFARHHNMSLVGFLAADRQNLGAGVQHALNLCLKNKALHLIVDEISTIALPFNDLINIFNILVSDNITVVFVHNDFQLTPSALGVFHQLLALSADADSKIRSHRIKTALQKKKRKGAKLGSRRFGFLAHESYVINQMVKLREQGLSLETICTMLTDNQIDSTKRKKWHPTTVKRILDRAKPMR